MEIIFLPALERCGLLVAGAAAASATSTTEGHVRQLAAALVTKIGGPTALLAGHIKNYSLETPVVDKSLRPSLAEQMLIWTTHAIRTEPAAVADICAGRAPQGECAASSFACRAYKRLCLWLAAPLIAGTLFRETQLAPSRQEIEVTLLDTKHIIKITTEKPDDKRQRSERAQ